VVLEIAVLEITPGAQDAFTAAYGQVKREVADSPGFRSMRLVRGVESPGRFVLLVEWDSVEAHEEGFRATERFGRWRAGIGPHFAAPPQVEHYTDVG
jgi:heme-degrading monooxygenase HmoA